MPTVALWRPFQDKLAPFGAWPAAPELMIMSTGVVMVLKLTEGWRTSTERPKELAR